MCDLQAPDGLPVLDWNRKLEEPFPVLVGEYQIARCGYVCTHYILERTENDCKTL